MASLIVNFWVIGLKSSTCFFHCPTIVFISNDLSNLPDDDAYIFAAFLLIPYCSFSSLILSSIVMISFYILSKRFFLKREELSDARVG